MPSAMSEFSELVVAVAQRVSAGIMKVAVQSVPEQSGAQTFVTVWHTLLALYEAPLQLASSVQLATQDVVSLTVPVNV